MPEFFGLAIEGGAAADHGPELPSELAAQVAKGPPAPQKVLAFGGRVARGKILAACVVTGLCPVVEGQSPATNAFVRVEVDLPLQRLEHWRDRHQHQAASPADRRH